MRFISNSEYHALPRISAPHGDLFVTTQSRHGALNVLSFTCWRNTGIQRRLTCFRRMYHNPSPRPWLLPACLRIACIAASRLETGDNCGADAGRRFVDIRAMIRKLYACPEGLASTEARKRQAIYREAVHHKDRQEEKPEHEPPCAPPTPVDSRISATDHQAVWLPLLHSPFRMST